MEFEFPLRGCIFGEKPGDDVVSKGPLDSWYAED
jgi:hypothetical protein